MKIGEVVKSILSASKGSISSKRVCGVAGWIVCLGIGIYCTIKVIQAPLLIDSILIGSAALLGVDSITGVWRNKNNDNV